VKGREERGVKTCMRERRLCVRCVMERERGREARSASLTTRKKNVYVFECMHQTREREKD
jgi:hypothetical protein